MGKLPGQIIYIQSKKQIIMESNQQKIAKRKLKVMADLDKIKEPLSCEITIGTEMFPYRNAQFWLDLSAGNKMVKAHLERLAKGKQNERENN